MKKFLIQLLELLKANRKKIAYVAIIAVVLIVMSVCFVSCATIPLLGDGDAVGNEVSLIKTENSEVLE